MRKAIATVYKFDELAKASQTNALSDMTERMKSGVGQFEKFAYKQTALEICQREDVEFYEGGNIYLNLYLEDRYKGK